LLTYETDFQDGFRPSIDKPGTCSVEVAVQALPLTPDIYLVAIGSRSGDSHFLDYIEGGLELEIIAGPAHRDLLTKQQVACDWPVTGFGKRP
jgi:hypothetical protein